MPENGSESVDQTNQQQPDDTGQQQAQTVTDERRYSVEEVNKIVENRLARERAKYPDYDDLKAKAGRLDELEQQQMGELEKANKRSADLEQQLAEATAARKDSLLRAAVVSEAAKRNVIDPDAALALVDRSLLEFGDDGAPTNIADAMDQLLKAKPYLVGGGATRGSADQGARGSESGKGQLSRDQLQTMTPEQIVKARREGRFDALARGEA